MIVNNESDQEHFLSVKRHIEKVQYNCGLVAEALKEEPKFARTLIANSYLHDNSKFYGIEWHYLRQDVKESNPKLFEMALEQHQQTNPHHPEYWAGGIREMPSIYLAELACDWKTRSEDLGTNLMEFVKGPAADKFGYNTKCKVYQEIKRYIDLLLEVWK